jgi:hypothetical protein
LLDMTTTVTGLLCWRDSHPLEWQLASLHGHFPPIPRSRAMSVYVLGSDILTGVYEYMP